MITTGFFGTSLPTGIIWYTPNNLGEISSDEIFVSLSTNLPCTYEIILFGSIDIVAPFILGDVLYMGNPKDNNEYTYSILAKSGVLSSVRTFKFIAKRTEPKFVTEDIIQLSTSTEIDYQLIIMEPRETDIYTIIDGELPTTLLLTKDGRIIGTNPFDNSLSSFVVQIDDGVYRVTKQFTLRASPNVLEYDLPTCNTIDTFGYNKGSFIIDDAWLISNGWDGLYSNVSVNIGSRYYPKDGTDTEGQGINNAPTVIVDVKRHCDLVIKISGDVFGPWGHKGENYSDNELFQYKHSMSLSGLNGGIALQLWSPCTIINSGTIYGGAGGGGAGGCGITYFGRNDPGAGGMGGAAIDIRSQNVIVYNHGTIGGGGGGGAGGWGSEQDGDEPGNSGTDGLISGQGGHGGAGTGTDASVGGMGVNVGLDGYDGFSVNYLPANGGKAGYAIQTEYTYTLIDTGTIIGTVESF
jgi:hypothetical protein